MIIIVKALTTSSALPSQIALVPSNFLEMMRFYNMILIIFYEISLLCEFQITHILLIVTIDGEVNK